MRKPEPAARVFRGYDENEYARMAELIREADGFKEADDFPGLWRLYRNGKFHAYATEEELIRHHGEMRECQRRKVRRIADLRQLEACEKYEYTRTDYIALAVGTAILFALAWFSSRGWPSW